jgi:hypothetical protein
MSNIPANSVATDDVLAAADLTVERGALPVVRGNDLRSDGRASL